MEIHFAPNSTPPVKRLFTGRTNTLKIIIEQCILADRAVALYGERRSGKTFVLLMLQDIIEGTVKTYQDSLVDETLRRQLPTWEQALKNYRAIYVSLQGTRTEIELVYELFCAALDANLIRSDIDETALFETFENTAQPLKVFFDYLKEAIIAAEKKLVILLDEMEVLEVYKENTGSQIGEQITNISNHAVFCFVHAGSYRWREYVDIPGSNFTHLNAVFLASIDQDDAIRYLLKPISDTIDRQWVYDMSGGKPLYLQFIGQVVYDAGHRVSEQELLNRHDLCNQIEQNIYREIRLDDDTHTLLVTLAHHPARDANWLANRLSSAENTSNILQNLRQFGTIQATNGKYRITGQFIAFYGRMFNSDPLKSSSKQTSVLNLLSRQHLFAALMLLVGFGLEVYAFEWGNSVSPPFRFIFIILGLFFLVAGVLLVLERKTVASDESKESSGPIRSGSSDNGHIFICHSQKDDAFVKRLAPDLRAEGLKTWTDHENIPATAQQWDNAVHEALDQADAILFVVTYNGSTSDECHREWDYGLHRRIPVIPIILEKGIELHFRLRLCQWVDFTDDYDTALARLIDELNEFGIEQD